MQVEYITRQNCEPLFVFSFLTEFYIPASAGTVINPSATFTNNNLFRAVIDWLRLHQGTSDIYKHSDHWLAAGPLTPLLWNAVLVERSQLLTQASDLIVSQSVQDPLYFQKLCTAIKSVSISHTNPGTPIWAEVDEDNVNFQALAILVKLFGQTRPSVSSGNSVDFSTRIPNNTVQCQQDQLASHVINTLGHLSHSFTWLFEIPTRYVELLESKRPASLVIFAHFALLLHTAPKFWWNKGMPEKIVKAVADVLPADFTQYIKWPIQEVLHENTKALI